MTLAYSAPLLAVSSITGLPSKSLAGRACTTGSIKWDDGLAAHYNFYGRGHIEFFGWNKPQTAGEVCSTKDGFDARVKSALAALARK